ncbi:hypothetical protein MCOR25_005767 [Pyricularia grisea]|nr:hypothetical protein MCOR25_005767 [Pyricularia grisea]
MRARSVSFMHLTPTVARLVPPVAVPSLNCYGSVGERINDADVEPWLGSGVELLNLYGLSEACIVTVARRIDPNNCSNIGRPVGCNT